MRYWLSPWHPHDATNQITSDEKNSRKVRTLGLCSEVARLYRPFLPKTSTILIILIIISGGIIFLRAYFAPDIRIPGDLVDYEKIREMNDFFEANLHEENYFDTYPPLVSLKNGKCTVIILGVHNYKQQNLTGTIDIDCELNDFLFKPAIKLEPNETGIYPIRIDTRDENPGSYNCILNLNNDSKPFTVIIE